LLISIIIRDQAFFGALPILVSLLGALLVFAGTIIILGGNRKKVKVDVVDPTAPPADPAKPRPNETSEAELDPESELALLKDALQEDRDCLLACFDLDHFSSFKQGNPDYFRLRISFLQEVREIVNGFAAEHADRIIITYNDGLDDEFRLVIKYSKSNEEAEALMVEMLARIAATGVTSTCGYIKVSALRTIKILGRSNSVLLTKALSAR